MGTEHSNQPFLIMFDRDAYFCICKHGTPAQCLNVLQYICDRNPSWQVNREFYTYQREGNALKAAVRPFHDTFAQSEDRHVIVDSSNMGTGKSYAADKYIYWRIEQWKHQHGEHSESQFKCLCIVHRVQLANEIHTEYLRKHDFKLYLDDNAEGGSVRDAKRLVICIDSLWKVEFEDWDCVIIDEIPEVLKSICRLKKKHPHSGKWNVWAKFRLVLQNCRRNILLSANADTLVRLTLDDLFEPGQQKWQQNCKATLGHLTYEIHHFEPKNAKDIGYGKIFELIDQGKRLAIPCAEKGEAIAIYEALIIKYPDKQGIKLEGSMADEEKSEVLTNVKQTAYDFFVYTASMDCGVSIDVTGYDRVVMCLGNRSIDAEVAMQMAARVRSTTDDTIVILCDTRVKDWNRWPGYREKKITEESERTQMLEKGYIVIKEDGINSVAKVKKYLMQTKARCLFYLWYSDHAKAWFSFRRILPPREYSFEEAKGMLLNPEKIKEAIKEHTRNSSDTNTDDANNTHLGQILDIADTDMINTTVEYKITKHIGLVDLMARVLKDDLNRPRNILTDIIRIAKMQEATVTHTYNFDEPPEGALGTKSAMAERKREEEKREIDAIYSAERPTREQFIADTATREQKRLEFAIRTFGEDTITPLQGGIDDGEDAITAPQGDIDETSPEATQPTDEPSDESSSSSGGDISAPSIHKSRANLMDFKGQKTFREQCALADPESTPSCIINERLVRPDDNEETEQPELDIEFGRFHHADAVQKGLLDLVEAFGFNSPFDYITSITIDDTKLEAIKSALANLDRAQNGAPRSHGRAVHSTSGGVAAPNSASVTKDPFKSACAKLQNMWFLTLQNTADKKTRSHKKGATTDATKEYRLTRHGKAKNWPTPSWERHIDYQEFLRWKEPNLYK